jgi:ubiquinone/menaquinone biosynthesis C-methylase UbiE
MSDPEDFTGERFVPGARGEIWYEHWHRYHFAAHLVHGAEVLDVACGSGYGSALLARHAARVTGAEISPEAVDRARKQYAAVPNLELRQADCSALPMADASFDAVVSFETIEHIAAQEAFLDEALRVLRPGGVLILSCPNKLEYSDKRNFVNPFHTRELYRDELAALLAPRFAHALWFRQRASFFSLIWPEGEPSRSELFEVSEDSAETTSPGHGRGMYFIVVAARSAEAIAGVPRLLSALADRDEWVYRDYEKVMGELQIAVPHGRMLLGKLNALQQHHDEAVRQRDAITVTAAARDAELREARTALAALQAQTRAASAALEAQAGAERNARAAIETELAARDAALAAARTAQAQLAAQVDEREREIARRGTLRWWLALPLRRLRSALRGASRR